MCSERAESRAELAVHRCSSWRLPSPQPLCGHLWQAKGEEFSWPGFIVALVAIPAMRYLALRKIAIAKRIGSRAKIDREWQT
jgi:hypothetical protein